MNEPMLAKFILSFLVDKEDYKELSQEQQELVFLTCRTIMTAIYNSIKYENVYQLKKEFPELEIIINGGIQNVDESLDHLKIVDGVMLGRTPYDNPMIVAM